MQEVILAIEKEISLREQELVALHESLNNLRKAASREPLSLAASAEVSLNQFAGQKVGAAIRTLMEKCRVATFDEIRLALTHGGLFWGDKEDHDSVNWGEVAKLIRGADDSSYLEYLAKKHSIYPKRQVALAISNSPKIYAVKGDTVTLR